RVLQLLLEKYAALLRFGDRETAEQLGQLGGVCVREIGRELGIFVVDFDADDATFLVRRDAHECRQGSAQRLEIGELVVLSEAHALIERTRQAVALEQCNVELVGCLRTEPARQAAERTQRSERGCRSTLLL